MELKKEDLKLFLNDKFILELGCNSGLVSKQILRYNPRKIYCIDFNQKFEKDIVSIDKKLEFKKINFLKKEELNKLPKEVDVVFLRDIFNCFDYETNKKILSNIYQVFGKDVKILLICFYKRVIVKSLILSFFKLNFKNGFKNYSKHITNNSFILNRNEKNKYFSNSKKILFCPIDLFQDHLSLSKQISNRFFKYTMLVE